MVAKSDVLLLNEHCNNMTPRGRHAWPLARAAILQLWLATAILGLCLIMPRPGGAVLLIPFDGQGIARVLHGPDKVRIAVLRNGALSGSLLVRIDAAVPIIAILREGVVPVGAPDFLCGPAKLTANQ